MPRIPLSTLILLAFAITLFTPPLVSADQTPQANVIFVRFEGTISSQTSELLEEVMKNADVNTAAIVVELNTPGGALDATFQIISKIEQSEIPVIGYVFPQGATAWSAGTYILLGTHVAAMAPNAIIGSGQPVTINPLGGSQPINDSKVINALTAYIEERAISHNRNATAAKEFITKNLNLNADKAKALHVIEIIAPSERALLESVDGITVSTPKGQVTLKTKDSHIISWSPGIRIAILRALSEPTIAYLLFTIGLFALIFGFSSPGHGAEIFGGIALVLGLIGLGITGVNIGAFLLIGIGTALMLVEVFSHGHGALAAGGIVLTILGGLLLFQGPYIISQSSLNTLFALIFAVPLVVGGFFTFAAFKILQARRRRPLMAGIVGEMAVVTDEIKAGGTGFVRYQGEYWKAKSDLTLVPGTSVQIKGKDGPTLIVTKKDS